MDAEMFIQLIRVGWIRQDSDCFKNKNYENKRCKVKNLNPES